MENPKPSSKMFLDIVGELKSIIKEEGIETGGNCLPNVNWQSVYKQEDPQFVKRYEVWNCSDLSKLGVGKEHFLSISGSTNLLKSLQHSSCNSQIPSLMFRKHGEFMKRRQS